MRSESYSIAFACALGAFVGGFLALEISTHFQYGSYLWGVGALFGGIVAYVAVDFRHFCAGVVHSYNKTIAWRPNREYWETYFIIFGGVAIMYNSIGLTFVGLIIFPNNINIMALIESTIAIYLCIGVLVLLNGMAAFFAFLPILIRDDKMTDEDWRKRMQDARYFGWTMMKWANPVGALVLGTYYTLKGALWTLMNSPWLIATGYHYVVVGLSLVKEFVVEAFFYVHSQRRTICFVDAALGSAVGYFCGSAIIGALAGALFGVVNYELVSVRWLKIAHARNPTD